MPGAEQTRSKAESYGEPPPLPHVSCVSLEPGFQGWEMHPPVAALWVDGAFSVSTTEPRNVASSFTPCILLFVFSVSSFLFLLYFLLY